MKAPLSQLLTRASNLGVQGTYLAFGDGNLRTWDWEHVSTLMSGDLQAAWKFLMLHGGLTRRAAEQLLGAGVVKALVDAGIGKATRTGVKLGQTVLLNYQQRGFFAELSADPKAVFSEDAKAIISALPRRDYRRCLSVYSGCGIEALVLQHRRGSKVVFVNPEADPRYLEASWNLNGLESELGFAKAKRLPKGDRYDLILARIPSWSLPADYAPAMFCPGGEDGTRELDACVGLVGERLESGGTCCFTCILYGVDSVGPAWTRLAGVAAKAGLELHGLCSSRQSLEPGVPLFNHLVGFLEQRTRRPVREIVEKLVNHFCDRRYAHAYFVRGRAVRGAGSGTMLDLSDRYYGNWSI